ncbi:MAG: site-2 protease family protein [Leptospirales bacterium]
MKWSLSLGKIAGIRLFVHWTFSILIVYIFFAHYAAGHGLREALWGAAFIIALFACVLLHELGHALTARRFGITTDYITLLPIGGLANMRRMPDRPSEELLVALAGPAVNFAIAGILAVYLAANNAMPGLDSVHTHQASPGNFLFNLLAVNVVLAVFNLIPAFPMDGGRALRALLAYRLEKSVATRIAAKTGQILAILFVFVGIFINAWLVFIGIFVYLGASAEASHENVRSVPVHYSADDAAIRRFRKCIGIFNDPKRDQHIIQCYRQ